MNKPFTYVVVTNPDEIASIQADGFEDIIGGQLEGGTWIAEKESLLKFRSDNSLRREQSNDSLAIKFLSRPLGIWNLQRTPCATPYQARQCAVHSS